MTVAVVAVVAAVVLGACGDDGESAAPTTTSTTLSQVQLDKQKAERANLSAADLSGYTEDAPDPEEEVDADGADQCVESNALLLRLGETEDPRGAASPDFSREVHTISSSVTFGETEDEARTALAVINRQTLATCLGDALAAELRTTPGFSNVRVTSSKLPAITAGDETVGYRLVVRGTAAGQAVTINVEFTFVRTGRGVAVFQSLSETSTFPAADRTRLVELIAGRMAA